MPTNYGTTQRTKPRLQVLRGWDPNNPTHRTQRAPIATGVTIKSGQVISLAWGSGGYQEWNLGVASATVIPFFAVQDSDDFDVISSGVLTGLSSLDNIELQTPYFKASPTPSYGHQVALKADGTTGDVTTVSTADLNAAGFILGYASRYNAPVNIAATNTEATVDGSGEVLVLTLVTAGQLLTADAGA